MAKKRQARPKATSANLDREILASLREISRKLTDVLHELQKGKPQAFDEGGEGG